MSTTTRHLPCEMTEEEYADYARRMADLTLEIERIQNENATLKTKRDTLTGMAHCVETGTVDRLIECRVEMDTPEQGRKTIIRTDTGEIAFVEDMTAEDLQTTIFDGEESIAGKAKVLRMPE